MRTTIMSLLVVALLIMGCEKAKEESTKANAAADTAEAAATLAAKHADVKKEYEALQAQFTQQREDAMAAYQKAPAEEKRKVLNEQMPKPGEYAAKFMALVDGAPDAPAAVDSLVWVVTNARGQTKADDGTMVDYGKKAMAMLFNDYADNAAIANMLPALVRGMPSAETEKQLQGLIENSSHDQVKGVASMAMFNFYENVTRYKGLLENPRFVNSQPKEMIEFLQGFDAPGDEKVAALLTSISENYPDFDYGPAVNGRQPGKIGEMADRKLFAIKYLRVGKEAPNIVANDLDGVEFQLADYRGKVVMLDFWGDW